MDDGKFGAGYVPRTVVVNRRTSNTYDVYVGRPTKWGNPFQVNQHGTRDECVQQYATWIKSQPHLMYAAMVELRGKRIACWCAPELCHAHVLAHVADYGHLMDLDGDWDTERWWDLDRNMEYDGFDSSGKAV